MPGGPAWRRALRGLAVLTAVAVGLPVLAPVSRAQDPPDPPDPPAEVVVTKEDLDPQSQVLRVEVNSDQSLGSFFDLVGVNNQFELDYANLRLEDTSLTLVGDFPIRVEISGNSPDNLPLRLKLDGVRIINPQGGPALRLTGDSNTRIALAGSSELASQAAAGLDVAANSRLTITDSGPTAGAVPSLAAQGGAGAGIGAASGAQSGYVTIDGDLNLYAEAGGTEVSAAGIGGSAPSAVRAVTINRGSVVAKGTGNAPGIGGIGSVIINGGFISAVAGTPDSGDRVAAVGGLTPNLCVNGGIVHGDTGLANPKNADQEAVYPVYAAPGLADINVTGASWLGQTATPDQTAWDAAHGGSFPADQESAVFWAPTGAYEDLNYTGNGGETTGQLAANVKDSAAPYVPGQWTNVLAAPLTVTAQANGTDGLESSTEFELTFSPAVPGLTIENLELANGSGAAVLGADMSTEDDGATWTVPLAGVFREGDVSLTVTPPADSNTDYAALPMPVSFQVNNRLDVISGGAAKRYATPLAVVAFTSQAAGTYFYRVVDAGDTASIPSSAAELVADHTGTDTLSGGDGTGGNNLNSLVLKGAALGMATPGAKTVYVVGRTSQTEQLTSLYAIDIPAAGDAIELTDQSTAAGGVVITATGPDSYQFTSGLTDTVQAVPGSVQGYWSQLNGQDGLRLDSDPILANGLTGARVLRADGADIDFSQPLALTLRDVALVTTGSGQPGIALTRRANVALNVEGTNTIAASGDESGGIDVRQASPSAVGQLAIASQTGGKLTVTAGRYAAAIGGGAPRAGGGKVSIGGNVQIRATGGLGISPSYPSGAAIGGGSGAVAGQITIGGEARVFAESPVGVSDSGASSVAIGSSGVGIAGNYLGSGDNWILVKDQAVVVANVPRSGATNPAIGVLPSWSADLSVRISGGTVVARSATETAAAIATGPNGRVVITGGSVAPLTANGQVGIADPVDAADNPVYPAYVPAAAADGTDLTNKDIDFGVNYPLHTLTAEQRAWLSSSGDFFPGPASVPLNDPAHAANNTDYLGAWAWLPVAVYPSRAGQAPDYDSAKRLGVDVQAVVPHFQDSRTNVMGLPVDLQVSANGSPGQATSTELLLRLEPALPGLTAADVQLAAGSGQAEAAGDLAALDAGATYTLGLETVAGEGTVTAKVRTHGFLSIPDAVVTVYRSSLVGVTPLNDGEGVRYFTSIFAGAGFNSTWAGKMYYRYGGQAPATAEALADEPDQTPATVVLGENVVPAAINYSVPAGEELKLYVTVKGENDEFSGLMTFTFPAYTGDGWFVLPSEMMASSIVQTVQSDGENFRLTGLTGGLDWLNNRDLLVARVPIEVGATPSTAWTYKVDGGSVNDVTLALRVNGLTASGLTSTSPLSLVNGAMVDLTVSGTNTLTVPVAPQPAVAAVDVPQGSRIHITSRPEEKGVLAVTGGGTNDSYYRGGAGVGGSQGGGAGTISIDGSVVIKAQGGKAAAGIGGGSTGSGGSITIGGLAVVESKGGTIAAGIGGGYYGAGGAITIRGDSVVSATGGADGYGGGAGIGGGQSKDAGLVTINGSASVTATGGRFAAGIGSGIMRDGGPSGTILIDGSASVTATGGDFSAGIGGGAGAYGPKVVISGDSAVTAASGSDGAGIGGGGKYGSSAGGMGEIEISGNAIVTATGSGSGGSVAIGGFGGPGSFDTDFIKITGSPTVLALGSGSSGGVIGGSSSYRANGTVVIEGGFVTARFRSSSTNYAIGWVTAGVKVTGGSIYCQVSAGTNSGIENPVNGDGDLLYPLFIPAYAGGADLTDLDLTAPPFPYEQHTITEAQRSFIAAKDSAAFPAPAGVPAGAGDSAKLAAELWVPSADLKDIELRSVPGFAATVTTKPINTYSTALVTNVLRNQVIALTAVADGEPYEVTSTKLTLTFEPPVPNLPRANVEVLSRTASVTADTAAWSSTDQGKTWVIPLKGVSGQGTVDVVVNRLPAGWDGYTVLGGTATTVNRKQVAELRPGRNWRALEGTAVVGFGSDVEMVDAANPAPKYWYLARPVGDAAPVDGAALKDTVEGLALGDGLGGYGLIRPGAINTATANSVRIYGLPSTSAQVVYVASEHIDPTDDSKSRFSDVIAIPVDAYQEKVSLVATNSDVGPELTLTAIGESTYAVSGATGEFEKINGLALPIADDTLELKGLTGSRHVVADRSDGLAADRPMPLRLNGSTIAVTAGGAPVKVANGANLSIDVVGSNTITNATSGVAAIHVPHGDPENSVTIVSGSGGELVVRQTGGSTSAIGGGVEQGGGNITVGGDLRLTAYSPQSLAGAAIGGGHSSSKTTTAGNIRIQDQAYVKAISTYYNTPSRIGTGGGGSSTTTAGPDQVIITGSPTVHVSTVGGYGNPTVKVEGGFVVASERVFGGDVRITGGSVYAAGGQGVGSPKNAAGDPLYPLYVPAILADGTPLTDLDVGGEGLPYTQHTVTAAQRAWVGSSSLPANFPATMDDLGRFAAVLWVPVPGGPGIIRDIKLGQGPSFAGATLGAARVLAAAPAWSTALANNIVASQVGITSLVANGEADKDTTTALTMTLDRPIPGLVVGELITVAGTGAVTATGLTGGGDTYTVSLADPPKNGQVGLGFANRSYVAPPASVEVYRDQSVRLSVTGPGVRHFTSVGGNFPVESNWEGTVYAQFGGTPPVTAQDVVDNAQATGDLAYGTSVVNAGAVVYGSAADAAIPVYMVAEGTNGAFSGIVLTELPFYAGDPDWFALPAGAFTAAVTATAVDSDVYRLTGMTGGLDWLNGKDLRFGDVPLELGSVFSGARKFTIDGAGLDSSGVLSVRARGLTLTGLYQPFVLQNRAKARLQVDGTNTIASTASSNDRFGSAVTVNPGTSLRITSGSAGTITATGGAYGQAVSAPGIGAVAGSGELTIDGNVVVTASGGVAGTGSGAAGIGSGYSCQANPCTTSPSMGGPVVIGGQAKVYATGAMAGSGIGGYAGANVSASGVTNSVVIRDQALVVARGGATAVGIGGGNIVSAGSGTVNITGGTVAAVPGAATLPAIGGLAAGAVKITGGNVYASNTNAGVSGPVNADGKPVYTLYVPAEFGSTDLTNSHIEAPGWDGSLDTITPEAMEQLEAWGAGTYWATGLAGAAWLTADTTKGLMLHGFTASGSAIMEGAKAARAFIAPQFRTFAEAGTAGYNILTGSGLNELSVSQDGAAGTATTKTLTLSLDEGATLTNAMVSIAPQGPFAASRDVLTAVGGSSGTEYWFRLSGNWAEGDILRVTFQQPTGGANPHVGPLVFDVVLHRDSVQPVLSDPQGTRLSASAGSVSFNASESGEVFYLTLPGDSPEPSADSVKAGQSQAMAAGANTISLNSLSQSGPYKVYILAQDPEGLWSAGLTAVDVPPVYAFSVVVAQDSLGRGSIIDPGSYAAEYPAGTELEIRGSGEPGFAIEYWDDGGADGEFDDAYSQNTVYTMPSGPVTVSAHFGTIVDYRTAEAVDGESGTATTTRVRLTFGGDMPDGFDATFVI
ncbi:MAG: hypothetical protein LBJ02_04575, partial [Bifidobacteriaceae bacterium]|nr:hypothetical protein [Bifidobacteriaceae bacterium]